MVKLTGTMLVCQFAFCVLLIPISLSRAVTQPEFADFETNSRIILSQSRGYKDVLIAIGETVPEDDDLIEEIMEIFTEFSSFLFSATDVYGSGVFFEEIRILIPSSWGDDARYEARTWETFAASDIRIDPPPFSTVSNRNQPSTNKPTSCGAPGLYIHLTPEYVTEDDAASPYGDRSRTLTHEWGHFRWGVFDEYPLPGDDHFYSTQRGTYEATKCVSAITGSNRRTDGRRCSFDSISGRPDDDCRFIDDRDESETYQASLMYKQFLPEMRTFCDEEAVTGSSPAFTHNALAPNQQNIQCAARSVWEVMRMHTDFPSTVPSRGDPPINALPQKNVVPTFRLIKQRRSRDPVVLVLDRSGSMGEQQRLHVLRQASYNLITRVLADNQLFGVVTFNDNAATAIELAETGQDRDQLTGSLPNVPAGGTSVGGGIREGIAVLDRALTDYSGAQMILLTDGEERSAPYIREVRDSELANITVHTIAIGPEASPSLEDVANRTGGERFEHSDRSAALFNIFTQLAIQDESDIITILSKSFVTGNITQRFSPGNLADDTMTILIGFPFGYLGNITVTVTKPNGDIIRNNTLPAATDTFRIVKDFDLIQVDTEVIRGEWVVVVEFRGNNTFNLTSTMHVEAARRRSTIGDQSPSGAGGTIAAALPIGIDAQWGLPTLDPCQIQTVQVTVSEGYTPVADAKVEVTVSRPNTVDPKANVEVFDDGVGADARKDDGVYTGFFTEFKGMGRYSMEVSVTGVEGVTKLMNGYRVGQGPAAIDPEQLAETEQQPQAEFTGSFNRFIGGTSFTCVNTEMCSGDQDIYSPYRITDLRVVLIENMTAVLTFTATGDDLDQGTASYYELRIDTNISDLVNRFNDSQIVESQGIGTLPPYVISGDLSSPLPARRTEMIQVKLPVEGGEFSYIFSVVAVDDDGHRSEPSNFASVTANPVQSSPLLVIILILIALLLLCVILIIAVILYRGRNARKKVADDVESTDDELATENRFTNALAAGVVNEKDRPTIGASHDNNANKYRHDDPGGNYRFVSSSPSVDQSDGLVYADRFTAVAYSTRDDPKAAEKIYVPPSEVQGIHNPVFDPRDSSPPDHPPPRSHRTPFSNGVGKKPFYVNDPNRPYSHAVDMMPFGPAGPVLPQMINDGQGRLPQPALRPPTPQPRSAPAGALRTSGGVSAGAIDQSDDEHDYDEPPPTGARRNVGDDDHDSDRDDYEPVLDPTTGIPYGMA